ncbi:MAG TPA: radical SAM protein [Pyrinomonadaceae bacterium]|nr:radical SAM protein [Pyrinomonadaceae bacterium]
MADALVTRQPRPPGRKLVTVELTNVCNLHCSYCMRDEDALYHSPANFFPVELLRRIMREARRPEFGFEGVTFTGGEVLVHPHFREVLEAVRDEGWKYSFVTNGWLFERAYPAILATADAAQMIAFSLDGATREAHDRWRGEGSFVRVMRAVTRCRFKGIPFLLKAPIRRDTVDSLQDMALMAARLGARAVHFSHLLPTSQSAEDESGLTMEERAHAEQEVALLSNILKMQVGIAAGYYNTNPGSPCDSLSVGTVNVDYRGRMTLCCNLSGYRGASDGQTDVLADLNREDFATGYERFRRSAEAQLERRRLMLEGHVLRGTSPDLYEGSPCLYCLQSFGKVPWQSAGAWGAGSPRSLPVLSAAAQPGAGSEVFLRQESV